MPRFYVYTQKLKRGHVGKVKSTETRDEVSITMYLQSEINFCSVRMPVNARCYVSTSLPPEPSSILYYFELNSGIGHYRPVANLAEAGL